MSYDVPQEPAPPPAPPATKPKTSQILLVVAFLVALLVAVVAVVVAVSATNSDDENSAAVASTSATSTLSSSPTPSPTPTMAATPEVTQETFVEWAQGSAGTQYISFTKKVGQLANALKRAAGIGSYALVAKGCKAFGTYGKAGLQLPKSPNEKFNIHWQLAMHYYEKAATYAPAIAVASSSAISGCADSISKGTHQITIVSGIIKRY